ncbi:ClcB-like voltage-gated chloride channel protein [Paraburkholderia fungorum]|uniref:Voltage-gated chloride channel protein ClcB n=1 Tax=Paraburkholderia fungorum TaxID=134537 RepID=A0A420FV06_9BURK|nr:ClcB-like voltage-gated chloride channel protein [Paraburkholderia fungorum]RKF36742.1 voltage-gated chloride channel protein ClcB [Paraburkholderia fungorum]
MNQSLSALKASISRTLRRPDEHAMLLWAVVAGVAGAYATAAFREGIDLLQRYFWGEPGDFVKTARHMPWAARVALPTVGGLVAGFCLVFAHRSSLKSGADYMEAVTVGDGVVPVLQSLWRSISSLFTIASGGSIGREGSMVQLAALCSSIIGRWARFDPARLRMLVACGAAAGITSAYSSPIAGAFFVTELVLGSMAMESFGPILISSVVANITMREFAGYQPPYQMPVFPAITGVAVLPFTVLGLLCGVMAPRFLQLLAASKTGFGKVRLPLPLKLGLGGLIVGIVSVWAPEVWGNGYEVVNSLLHEPWTWTTLLIVLVLKVIATLATAGTGAIGGVFTPTLFVGAVVGCIFGIGVHGIWPQMTTEPFAYAIVGMGAFLAAATNAPLMAILMIFEMTSSYQVVLPLILSCVIAYFIARNAEHTSMYEVTVRRNLAQKDRMRVAATRMRDLLKPAETIVAPNTSVEELTRMFLEHPVKYLYVVDNQKRFCGVVPLDSVAADLASLRSPRHMKAVDYLLPDFHVLTPDMTLGEALRLFLTFPGERLPVVDKQSESPTILGVVHKTALLDTYVRITPTTH